MKPLGLQTESELRQYHERLDKAINDKRKHLVEHSPRLKHQEIAVISREISNMLNTLRNIEYHLSNIR